MLCINIFLKNVNSEAGSS